ncbi:hypothetical protein M8J77_023374 [Diaphorina citri]|nr:hypothetical protein M8J77_023374 [Diaphorina citri]
MLEERSIVVRHVPRHLRDDQIEDLFATFGGTGVRVISSKGKKTALVFVTFRSLPEAQCAISRIHQMEVMGYRLSAELSNKTFYDQEPQGKCDSFRDKEAQYLTLLKRLHLDQVTPPGLKYKYPHPTLHVLLNIISALCEHRRFYTQVSTLTPHDMKYKYPHPTLHVLLNIISALYEHKRFYTQVLHLMNKMNLPCPLNREYKRLDKINRLFLHQKSWGETQLYQDLDEIDISTDLGTKNTEHPPDRPDLDQVPMQVDQSDTEDEVESEIDLSDTESDRPENRPDNVAAILNLKRALERRGVSRIKRPKFIKPMQAGGQSRRSDASKQDEVFDTATSTPASQRKKHIAVHVSADLSSITTHSDTPVEEIHSFGGTTNQSDQPIEEIYGFNSITTQSDQPIRSIEANKSPENPSERSTEGDKEGPINLLGRSIEANKDGPRQGRISSIEANKDGPRQGRISSIEANKDGLRQGRVSSDIHSQAEVKEGEDSQEVKRVITKEQLDSNRLGERDRSFVKAFNNYEPGSPSCRLYMKNLAKQVTLPDLEFIYRRYYLPDYKEQGTMFDIRLMQEGRMKGQAFITLQTVDQAKLALQETNGYILKDKPMVVQYARSIQAKPAP